MNKLETKVLSISLFIYLTLVIMNSIGFIGIIASIGSVGKLLFCLVFIGGTIMFTDKGKINISFSRFKEWIFIIVLLLIFSAYYMLSTSTRINLLPNLAFPVYFVFYFLIIKLLIRIQKNKAGAEVRQWVEFNILSIFRKTLFVNFVFWFVLAFVSGINMYEDDGGFGGFYQDEIHFGLFVVTGFLLSFYFRFNNLVRDTSIFNTSLLLVYGGIALFTSRNAFLIILVVLIYYFIISMVKNRFYKVILFTLTFIGVNISLMFQDFSEKDLISFTSGRYQIWSLALESMFSNNLLLFGNGLFNLNDVVLSQNKYIGFYYFDNLKSLSFHNSYIELLAGGGIFVLLFFFIIIRNTWKYINRVNRSILVGILVGATFESFLVQPFMLISILLYIIIILNNTEIKFQWKQEFSWTAPECPAPVVDHNIK